MIHIDLRASTKITVCSAEEIVTIQFFVPGNSLDTYKLSMTSDQAQCLLNQMPIAIETARRECLDGHETP